MMKKTNKRGEMEWSTIVPFVLALALIAIIIIFPTQLKAVGEGVLNNLGIDTDEPVYDLSEVGTIKPIQVEYGAQILVEQLNPEGEMEHTPAILTKKDAGKWKAEYQYVCEREGAKQWLLDVVTIGGQYPSATICEVTFTDELYLLLKNPYARGKITLGKRIFVRENPETEEWEVFTDDEDDGTLYDTERVIQEIAVYLYKKEPGAL